MSSVCHVLGHSPPEWWIGLIEDPKESEHTTLTYDLCGDRNKLSWNPSCSYLSVKKLKLLSLVKFKISLNFTLDLTSTHDDKSAHISETICAMQFPFTFLKSALKNASQEVWLVFISEFKHHFYWEFLKKCKKKIIKKYSILQKKPRNLKCFLLFWLAFE